MINRSPRLFLPPAIGQVAVLATNASRIQIPSLAYFEVVLIIKPDATFPVIYFKFPGGMVKKHETFPAAAGRELKEETGAIVSQDPQDLVELCRTQKAQFFPHTGYFDFVFFAAFGCDFSDLYDPLCGELGDEYEEVMLARSSDIFRPNHMWNVLTKPSLQAALFPDHIDLLQQAAKKLKVTK